MDKGLLHRLSATAIVTKCDLPGMAPAGVLVGPPWGITPFYVWRPEVIENGWLIFVSRVGIWKLLG